jgi:hypothetical protein
MSNNILVDGNNFISHKLKNNIPFVAGKIGVTELNILYTSRGDLPEYLRHEVEDIAGLYPYNKDAVNIFVENMVEALRLVDLIPKWNRVIPQFEDYIFTQYCGNAYKTLLHHLEPYLFDRPWTQHLENKKILVFSPFADSITRNYQNFDKIWNGKITANFKLKTYKYPFALKISPDSEYATSNDVYEKYLNILRNEDFDVGIFGTGYTSLLFAAECKRLGKSGIHLGGPTQILFGIKGNRWKEMINFQELFNSNWTEPQDDEKPEKYNIVEGGCYW